MLVFIVWNRCLLYFDGCGRSAHEQSCSLTMAIRVCPFSESLQSCLGSVASCLSPSVCPYSPVKAARNHVLVFQSAVSRVRGSDTLSRTSVARRSILRVSAVGFTTLRWIQLFALQRDCPSCKGSRTSPFQKPCAACQGIILHLDCSFTNFDGVAEQAKEELVLSAPVLRGTCISEATVSHAR